MEPCQLIVTALRFRRLSAAIVPTPADALHLSPPIRMPLPSSARWLVCLFLTTAASAETPYVFYHEHVLGTSMELKLAASSPDIAQRTDALVLAEIERLATILSRYDSSSEFSRWARTGGAVSADLRAVLKACDRWRERSAGAFNPAVQTYADLWQAGQRRQREPSDEELRHLMPEVLRPAWRWSEDRTSTTRTSDCPLTLDALAKGYIIDRCCEVAMRSELEIKGLLLAIGGDMRACGSMSHWVELANPRQPAENAAPMATLRLVNLALATSGGYQRGWDIGGRHYSHILDPRTGRPAEQIVSATVTAPRAQDADALATILCVLPPEQGLRLVAELPRTQCLLVDKDGRIYRSAGWREAWLLAQAQVPPPAEGGLDGHELVIRFEINRPDAPRYLRPYLVVWIESPEGTSLRTVLLWVKITGSGPTWVADLKRWFRQDLKRLQTDRRDFVDIRSSPTRPPGKYETVWDGLDDNGRPLPPGKYVVKIEAAREHGTYQMIQKDVELGASPFKLDLDGGVEIKSASLDYRKRSPTKTPTSQ